jgi:undecaprenyl-diphosphatase
MLAVLLKFRRDYFNIIKSFFPRRFESDEIDIKKRNWLIIATIGTGITAIPLYFIFKFLFIEGFSAKGGDILTMVISGLLIITGIVLIKFKASYGNKDIKSISKEVLRKDSLISGLVQGVSILPGISRSGFTVSSMLFERYQQEKALFLSFIMSVPVIIASIGVDILFGEGSVFGILDPITIIITTGVSFIVGYLTMNILLKIANRIGFGYFCIIYGLVALAIILPITIF